jgi:hypothetical protein
MADVEFERENFATLNRPVADKNSRMQKMLINTGIAKNARQADIIFIIISAVFIFLAIYIGYKTFSTPKIETVPGIDILRH